jgi:hypothetical protein
MKAKDVIPQPRMGRCPTCGANPAEKCELHSGQPRTEPHSARPRASTETALVAAPSLDTREKLSVVSFSLKIA